MGLKYKPEKKVKIEIYKKRVNKLTVKMKR